MSGAQRIKEKILMDAEANARQRLAAARAEAATILEEADKQRRETELASEQRIAAGKAAQEKRNEATLHTEERKQALSVRQRLVEEAFRNAGEKLRALPDDHYAALLSAMLLNTAWKGSAEIVVSERDRNRLGSDWLESLDARRMAAGLEGKTTYAEDRLPEVGGFVVRVGDIEMNGTFPVVLSGMRPTLEHSVVKALFE